MEVSSIYIYGDSHARFNFENLSIPNINLNQNSITMFRIGRDNMIINFSNEHNGPNNTFILCYGEVDCRCHIGQQIRNRREIEEVCESLVSNYFNTIKNNITEYKQIIICSIVPTMDQNYFESIYGPITHEFPFVGDDNERINNTNIINKKLKEYCEKYNFKFLDFNSEYSNSNGTLNVDDSDNIAHILKNEIIHKKLFEIL